MGASRRYRRHKQGSGGIPGEEAIMETLGCKKMDSAGRKKRNKRKSKRRKKIPAFAQPKLIPFGIMSPHGHIWKNPVLAATPLEARLEARRLLLTRRQERTRWPLLYLGPAGEAAGDQEEAEGRQRVCRGRPRNTGG